MRSLQISIRADASPTIGFGHVMRCITLGTALVERGHEVTLVTREPVTSLQERCEQFGIGTLALQPSANDVDVLRDLHPDLVVLDGYHLTDVAAELHPHGLRWMGIDDNRELPLTNASAVLNHNLFATPDMYPELPEERVWAGPDYALLREDITALPCREEQREQATEVLLSMGGADPLELSEPLALGIADAVNGTTVRVASNPGRRRHEDLQKLVASVGSIEFATADLLDSFNRSDIAVIGAGTTLWETGYLGIPTIALVTADNQRDGARSAGEAGIAVVLDARAESPDRIVAEVASLAADQLERTNMMKRGRELFDGAGPSRVARCIEDLVAETVTG